MSNTIRTCLMASAIALVLAGCQSRSADAPAGDAEEEPVMLAGQDAAEMHCYSVALPGAGLISLGPRGGEPTRISRLVEGNPCAG